MYQDDPFEDYCLPVPEGHQDGQFMTTKSNLKRLDADKITSIEDIKLILKALDLACNEFTINKYKLEHLVADENKTGE